MRRGVRFQPIASLTLYRFLAGNLILYDLHQAIIRGDLSLAVSLAGKRTHESRYRCRTRDDTLE